MYITLLSKELCKINCLKIWILSFFRFIKLGFESLALGLLKFTGHFLLEYFRRKSFDFTNNSIFDPIFNNRFVIYISIAMSKDFEYRNQKLWYLKERKAKKQTGVSTQSSKQDGSIICSNMANFFVSRIQKLPFKTSSVRLVI